MLPATDIACPYCGERITVLVDASGGPQHYIEDCQVCCRPIAIHAWVDAEGDACVDARAENEA